MSDHSPQLILGFDGGGSRGLFSVRLLQRIETTSSFLSRVSLFAGTSTGGIIAVALAAGFTVEQILTFYLNNIPRIFTRSPKHMLLSLGELTSAKYGNDQLKTILTELFSNRMMNDLLHRVAVMTYDAVLHRPIILTEQMQGMSLVDACLATSAAPVYFPSYHGYIDGGISANNPVLAATAYEVAHGHEINDIWALSIGTGKPQAPAISPDNWGAVQWVENGLIDLILRANTEGVDRYCRSLIGNRYCRVDGVTDATLDQVSDLTSKLLEPANQVDIAPVLSWLASMP